MFIARRRSGDYLGRFVNRIGSMTGRHLESSRVIRFILDVEDVVLRRAGLLLFGFFLALLVVFDLIRFEDLDFEILEDREDVIDFLLVFDGVGQRLIDVVEREVALLLREADQVANFIIDPAGGQIDTG